MSTYSLGKRFTGLVVGVSTVSLMLYALLFFVSMHPLLQDSVQRLTTQASMALSVLRQASSTERSRFAAALNQQGIRVSMQASALDEPGFADHEDGMPPELMHALRDALGPEVPIFPSGTKDAPTLTVGQMIDGQVWWLKFDLPQPATTSAILSSTGLVVTIGLAAALSLILGVRLITRPMFKLAQDMLARRSALTPIETPAKVSVELKQVIQSFNDMVSALRRSEQAKRQLLAGVSHDLRTPLARLRLRTELECSDEAYKLMEADFTAVTHIVDQFLAYAQGFADTTTGGLKPLADTVTRLVSTYRDSGKPISLVHMDDIRQVLPNLYVQRILSNLIDNALVYGKPAVEVSLHVVPGGHELVVFDHGRGIAPSELSRAMQPFNKLNAHVTAQGHCGLGLAIVGQMADCLHGRIVLKPFDGTRSGIGVFIPQSKPS